MLKFKTFTHNLWNRNNKENETTREQNYVIKIFYISSINYAYSIFNI